MTIPGALFEDGASIDEVTIERAELVKLERIAPEQWWLYAEREGGADVFRLSSQDDLIRCKYRFAPSKMRPDAARNMSRDKDLARTALASVNQSAGTPHGQFVSLSADETDLVRRLLKAAMNR